MTSTQTGRTRMISASFATIYDTLEYRLRHLARPVDSGHWQGESTKGKPDMVTYEILNQSFTWGGLPKTKEQLAEEVKPNLPWAEDHFLERVGGEPLNPGEQYKNWPFYKHRPENDRFRHEEGKFTHTYMERIWTPPLEGIRYKFGNLDHLILLLMREPYTRQAFLPIWFPEDTGAMHEGRVPCTLGYHFIRRGEFMQVTYYIRSCDWVRHFKDDVYLAIRLLHWVLEQLATMTVRWEGVKPSYLVFHCTSLHMFTADRVALGWTKKPHD